MNMRKYEVYQASMSSSISRNDETLRQECVTNQMNMFVSTLVDEMTLFSSGFSPLSISLTKKAFVIKVLGILYFTPLNCKHLLT